jgi:putative MATE family efflux protein
VNTKFHRNVDRLAQASIGRALLSLAFPIVLSNAAVTSYQFINAFWVGRLGTSAIGAIAVSSPVIFLLAAPAGGIAVAAAILAAQYAGQHKQDTVVHVSAQTVLLALSMAFLLAAIGSITVRPLLDLMGVGPDILADAARYMHVSILTVPFMFALGVCNSILQSLGETRLPLYVMSGSIALNIILDPLFIFGWGPVPQGGVLGAAYATLVTEGFAAIVGFRILFGGQCGLRLRIRDFLPDAVLIKRILRLALPASTEQSAVALGMLVMTSFVSHFGTTAIAAYGVGYRVLVLMLLPALGISVATGTLVGQSVGAGNSVRARKSAIVSAGYSFVVLTIGGIIGTASSTDILRFFVFPDPAVISEGACFVRALAIALGFIGMQASLIGAIRANGDTLTPMVLSIVSIWVIQVPSAFVLSHYTSLQEQGLWFSFPISSVATALLTAWRFQRQSWKPMIQTSESSAQNGVKRF